MSFFAPFEYEFFRNGFIAAVVIGALCGFIGVYVVLRRMSYIGHGLSHAIFGGAVLSYVLNVNFFIGGGLWALLAGVLIHWISHRRWVGADAAIGVVTTSSFALGVAIISTHRRFTRNIEAALFGNILGITQTDVWIVVGISLIVFCALYMIRRPLLFSTFDPEVASAYGVSTGKIDLMLRDAFGRHRASVDADSRCHTGGGRHGHPAGDRPLSDAKVSDPAHRLTARWRAVRRRRDVIEFLFRHLFRRDHRVNRGGDFHLARDRPPRAQTRTSPFLVACF